MNKKLKTVVTLKVLDIIIYLIKIHCLWLYTLINEIEFTNTLDACRNGYQYRRMSICHNNNILIIYPKIQTNDDATYT